MGNFSFCGKLIISNKILVKEDISKNGNHYKNLKFILKQSNNTAFIKLFGTEGDFNTRDKNDNKIKVIWDNRENYLNQVADFCKYKYQDNKETKEFISKYDMINYLLDNIEKIKDKNIFVKGNISYEYFKDKWNSIFEVNSINIVDDNTKNNFKIREIIYYNKESIDLSEWKEKKKITIYGYVENKAIKKYIPYTCILDASKIDFNNEKQRSLIKWRIEQLGIVLNDDNTITNKIGRGYYKSKVAIKYINGTEEIPFDESQLTENQKYALKIGAKTIDDFRPNGKIYGDKIEEFRIYDFDIRNDFKDGNVRVDDDFENNIYQEEYVTEFNSSENDNDSDSIELF